MNTHRGGITETSPPVHRRAARRHREHSSAKQPPPPPPSASRGRRKTENPAVHRKQEPYYHLLRPSLRIAGILPPRSSSASLADEGIPRIESPALRAAALMCSPPPPLQQIRPRIRRQHRHRFPHACSKPPPPPPQHHHRRHQFLAISGQRSSSGGDGTTQLPPFPPPSRRLYSAANIIALHQGPRAHPRGELPPPPPTVGKNSKNNCYRPKM